MQILGILLVLALLYAAAVGLGITRNFKRHKDVKKTLVIDDFENERDDFDWTTGGYVKMESSTENQTHGKHSAKVTFLTASQFFPTPTPDAVWQPQAVLDTNSVTRLSVFEWQDYTSLKLDVYNPQDQPLNYHIQIADARAFVYETSGVLNPKKVSNLSISMEDLEKARLDLTSIRSFRFRVDANGVPAAMISTPLATTTAASQPAMVKPMSVSTTPTAVTTPIPAGEQPIVVYLDYLRLEADPAEMKKK